MTEKDLNSIVQEEIGNKDPFWNEPVLEVVKKIMTMPEGNETSISELLNDETIAMNVGLEQQMSVYNHVISVCNKIGIGLQESREGESAYLYKIKKNNVVPISIHEANIIAEKELGCEGEIVIKYIYETSTDYIFIAGISGQVHVGSGKLFYINKNTRLGRIVFMTPGNRQDILQEIKESTKIL